MLHNFQQCNEWFPRRSHTTWITMRKVFISSHRKTQVSGSVTRWRVIAFFLYVLFWSSEEIWNWKCNKSHGKDDNLPLLFPPMLPLSQTNKQWYYIIKRSSHLSNSGWVYVVSTFVKTNILTLLCYNVIMVWCIVYSITV